MTRITLICGGGMSTSLMANKMSAAAAQSGIEVQIKAMAESVFQEEADNTDILLLGPQVSYLLKKMKKDYEPRGIKVGIINNIDYGMMNGDKVLKYALQL